MQFPEGGLRCRHDGVPTFGLGESVAIDMGPPVAEPQQRLALAEALALYR